MDIKVTSHDFLNAHKIYANVYVTGMFYSGITIYNQQVRTLNLVYFLTQKGIVKKTSDASKIVIIGGGMAGLTAAIAFKKLGYKVVILEEKSLLLHLQHGCTTRQIHPNLFLWPRIDSLKPFTELPFANWTASDAANIEKTLKKEFENERKDGGIEVIYNVAVKETRINLTKKKITYKVDQGETGVQNQNEKNIPYKLLLLATGFGLERYVGRQEITKSYWRNEDFGQLRIKDQINNFFISGVGDGGVSDVFRLALTGFDSVDITKVFENVKRGRSRLINRLRNLEKKARSLEHYIYYKEFQLIYRTFSDELVAIINNIRRSDISEIYLNGRESLNNIYAKGKMSFINAWTLFVLQQQKLFKYHQGNFPDDCGGFIFTDESKNKYQIIVRHGTIQNEELFNAFNKAFVGKSEIIKDLQKKKEYNDFSTSSHWALEYWSHTLEGYTPKKYAVSPTLASLCSVLLTTLEGLIRNFARGNIRGQLNFRMTLHRLVCYSDKYYFQQISKYVGDRTDGDPGRAFPIDQGIVGFAMRTNTCCSLIRNPDDEGKGLYDYEKIFARQLPEGVKSFFVVPVPSRNKKAAVICLYIDTNEESLVTNDKFRQLVYWSLTSFIKDMESKNVEEREVSDSISPNEKKDRRILASEVLVYNDEIRPYWRRYEIRMRSNRLIDIYAK